MLNHSPHPLSNIWISLALELRQQPLRLPLPFLHQEYDDISKLTANGSNLMIVSGQPGTGEVLVTLLHKI